MENLAARLDNLAEAGARRRATSSGRGARTCSGGRIAVGRGRVRLSNALAAARLLNGGLHHHDPVVDLTDRLLSEAEQRFARVVRVLDGSDDGRRAA